MNRLALAALALCALLLAACGEPLPQDKHEYAGEWRGAQMRLLITPDGRCEYERLRQGGASTSISAPIQRFEGDNFVVGVGPMSTTFVVTRPPHVSEGRWKMVVDGVELTRLSAPGEVQTSI
jgi:hypothetical protein